MQKKKETKRILLPGVSVLLQIWMARLKKSGLVRAWKCVNVKVSVEYIKENDSLQR